MARPPQLVQVARQAAGGADHHCLRVAQLVDRADQLALAGQRLQAHAVDPFDFLIPFAVQTLRLLAVARFDAIVPEHLG